MNKMLIFLSVLVLLASCVSKQKVPTTLYQESDFTGEMIPMSQAITPGALESKTYIELTFPARIIKGKKVVGFYYKGFKAYTYSLIGKEGLTAVVRFKQDKRDMVMSNYSSEEVTNQIPQGAMHLKELSPYDVLIHLKSIDKNSEEYIILKQVAEKEAQFLPSAPRK